MYNKYIINKKLILGVIKMKKKQFNIYRVNYSFYEGCTDYINVTAKNVEEASKKAIRKLEHICSTDDWDIESIEPFRG